MRLILAEDAALLREGLVRLLTDAGFDVVAAVPDADALEHAVAADPPDVVITDIRMPPSFGDEGLVAALAIRDRHHDVGVLVLSQYLEAAYAERLLGRHQSGVGYLLKDRVSDVGTLVDAITRVARGEAVVDPEVVRTLVTRSRRDNPLDRLNDREREVLGLMAEGRSNAGIGEQLFLAPKTVETYVSSILTKLDLHDTGGDNRRVLAVLRYLRG